MLKDMNFCIFTVRGVYYIHYLDYVMDQIQGAPHLAEYCVSVFPCIWTLGMALEGLGRYEQ